MSRKKAYSVWPLGPGWIKVGSKEGVVDSRLADATPGLQTRTTVPAGQDILLERPLFYSNFETFDKLPPKVRGSSSVTCVAYDLLSRKVGGMRMLLYLSKRGGGESIYLAVTKRDEEAIAYMKRRFRGIKRHTIIKLLKTIELSATWNVTPLVRVVVGMGLYEVISGLDHSCEPNVRLNVNPETGEARLITIRDLAAGERIMI